MEDGENILPSRLNIVSLRVHHLRHTADDHVANSCWSVIDRKEINKRVFGNGTVWGKTLDEESKSLENGEVKKTRIPTYFSWRYIRMVWGNPSETGS